MCALSRKCDDSVGERFDVYYSDNKGSVKFVKIFA